jgi:glycosyltransferase involved in cell wall biosynthesis
MSNIAIVHPDLNKMGGAEAVCMNIIKAIPDDHVVDLISLTEPEQSELESFYDILFMANSVRTGGQLGPLIRKTTSITSDVVGIGQLGVLDAAMTNWIARRQDSEYDLVISSMSEMYFQSPSIQYVHYPNFYRRKLSEKRLNLYDIYEFSCQKISKSREIPQDSTTYLANSEWTATQFERIYQQRPKVLYPPVDTSGFDPVPWDEREEGILVVGRVGRDKRLLGVLDTFESLKQRGYEGHLRIVGPIHDQEYFDRVQNKADTVQDVEFDGMASREKLISMMSSYKYGIHGKEREHFGMVIAEYVAAGMIPFLPDSGGQPEIVNSESILLYDSWRDLEEKMESVFENSELQREIQQKLPDIEAQFGAKRFAREFEKVIESKLN